jgi:hypothetical protein
MAGDLAENSAAPKCKSRPFPLYQHSQLSLLKIWLCSGRYFCDGKVARAVTPSTAEG